MTDRFDDPQAQKEARFESVLQELESGKESGLIAGIIEALSSLSTEQLERLRPIWNKLDSSYRLLLMQMLIDASQSDSLLLYDELGILNLDAPEPEIRKAAIEMIAVDATVPLVRKILAMAQNDESVEVRIEAINSLGRFVLLGEYEEIPHGLAQRVQEALLAIHKNQENNLNLRRFALEAVANATREDVAPLIEAAYANNNPLMKISAVAAMGNSCDNRWETILLQELHNEDAQTRREAVRAAGLVQIEKAVPRIAAILDEDDLENDERDWIVWSLGEIGGDRASRVLNALLKKAQNDEDEDLELLIDDALSNAQLAGDFMMLDFSDYEDIDFDDFEEGDYED